MNHLKFVEFKKAETAGRVLLNKHNIYRIEETRYKVGVGYSNCVAIFYVTPNDVLAVINVDHTLEEVKELIK